MIINEKYLPYIQAWFAVWFIGFFWGMIYLLSFLSNEPTKSVAEEIFGSGTSVCNSYMVTDAFTIDSLNYPDKVFTNVSLDTNTNECVYSDGKDTSFKTKKSDVENYVEEWAKIRLKEIKSSSTWSVSDAQKKIDMSILKLENRLTQTWSEVTK